MSTADQKTPEYLEYPHLLPRAQERIEHLLDDWVPGDKPLTILLDGLSGAGKTEFSKQLYEWLTEYTDLPVELIAVDDYYQGWNGLNPSEKITSEQVLDADTPHYHYWDWTSGDLGARRDLDPHAVRIIDGCGSITPATIEAARLRSSDNLLSIVLVAPEELRKPSALRRDPDYAPYWDMWEKQAQDHLQIVKNIAPQIDLWATRTEAFDSSPG